MSRAAALRRPAPRTTAARPRARMARAAAPVRLTLCDHDVCVLGLLLIERLSLIEAALALGSTPGQVRRDYDLAVARVRRSLAPLVATAAAGRRVRIARALRSAS